MRRALVQLAIALVLVWAGLVGLILAIDQGFQRDRLLDWASDEAAAALGLEVEIGRSVGRLSEGLDLRNVRLGTADSPLVAIDRLRVVWHLDRSIEDRAIIVETVQIDGWKAWFERDRDGHWTGPHTISLDEQPETTPSVEATWSARADRILLGPGLVHLASVGEGGLSRLDLAPLEGIDRLTLETAGRVDGLSLGARTSPAIDTASLEIRLIESISPNGRPLVDSLHGRASLDADHNLPGEFIVQGPSIDVEAELAGTRDRIDQLRASFDLGTASPFVSWIPALAGSEGRATGTLQATGPWPSDTTPFDPSAYEGSIELVANATALPDALGEHVPPGAAQLDAALRWTKGEAEVDRLIAHHAAGLDIDASGGLRAASFEGFELRAALARSEAWLPLLPETASLDLSGPLELSARLDGAFDAPVGSLHLTSDALHLGDRIIGRVDLTARRRDAGEGHVDLAIGRRERPSLVANALLESNLETATLTVRADLDAVAEREGLDPAEAPSGAIRFDGRLERERDDVRLDGVLVGRALAWSGRPVGDSRIELRAKAPASLDRGAVDIAAARFDGPWGKATLASPTRLTLAADRRWEASAITLDLEPAPSEEGAPAREMHPHLVVAGAGRDDTVERITLRTEGLPAAWISEQIPDMPSLGGTIDADAVLGLAEGRLETRGWIQLDAPRYGTFELEKLRADWQTDASLVGLRLAAEAYGGVPLSIDARIPVPADISAATLKRAVEVAEIDARLEDFDLAALDSLTPNTLRAPRGRLEGTFRRRLDPATGRLEYDGRLSLREGAITVPLLRRRFSPIVGTARLAEGRLVLDALELGSEQAGGRLFGSVGLGDAERTPIDARLELHALPISRSPLFKSDATGNLQWTGTLQEPVLRGQITLSETQIRVPAADDRVLREIRFVTSRSDGRLVESTSIEPDFVASSDLDIEIRVPSDTRIRGEGAHLWVEGAAQLRSRPGEALRVVGEGRVVNGTYTLQGRRFRVQRGTVRLVGDAQLDPVLDVVAELPINDITAIVDVGGRLSAPVVRLRSSPPMSEQDVLAYLIFGRPAESVGAAGGTRFDTAAAQLVAGVAEGELREILGDAMPVDSFEIGTNDAGEANALGFGKYLRPDLHVRYVHVLGDEPADRVGIEYRLNDLISVGSSVSTTGDAGLDLILRHDF